MITHTSDPSNAPDQLKPLQSLGHQRSHLLVALSAPFLSSASGIFTSWYSSAFRQALAAAPGVLTVRQFLRDEVDITSGHHAPLPFPFLTLCELSVDGAEASTSTIELVQELHSVEPTAAPAATWLYFPVSEIVGQPVIGGDPMLTIAFANPVSGRDQEFREWYSTRHIRHALNIDALTSGQCFERTAFQKPGAAEAAFAMIAIYQQIGPSEEIIRSFETLPAGTFAFPTMDLERFAEAAYRPLPAGEN